MIDKTYTQADLQAAVAAAMEEAAKEPAHAAFRAKCAGPRDAELVHAAAGDAERAIRALITPAMIDALADRDERIRREERELAATDIGAMLRELLSGQYSSLTISFNDDHACNYETAKEWANRPGNYDGSEDDRIDWLSDAERLKAIDENSVWTVQWYPNTPVGFNCIGASTFEGLIATIRADMEGL